jgi:murein DD-endopeptidase MepM/ murein hydrolase activator NlpD
MKKILIFLLIILPLSFLASLYFLDKHYFICPIAYPQDIIIRSDGRGDGFFGAERNGNRLHQGVDFLAKVGTPVLASRSGIVIAATQNRGMGKYVIIKHSGGLISIYGHLSQIYVHKYQYIRQGDIIGSVGKTGNANYRGIQPHLHFEIRKQGIPQNPLEYLE